MDSQPGHGHKVQASSPPVYWLLGLPFDCVSLAQARHRIQEAVERRSRLLLATPNLNFVRAAQTDPLFHRSLMRAGLSVVDGMSLVWIGRFLGVPFPERVAGSCLAEAMVENSRADVSCTRRGPRKKVRAFFFGGADGIADAAASAVNQANGGLEAVGALSPGFGSVEDMSTPEVLQQINGARADFLIVALGASKGHAWIEHNWRRLTAPVISHLGAVINFLAGTVPRAPRWMQVAGLEWLWRILHEPVLGRRYASDAAFLLQLSFTTLLPLAWRHVVRTVRGTRALSINSRPDTPGHMALEGALTAPNVPRLLKAVPSQLAEPAMIRIDLSGLTDLDCRGAGALFELAFRRPDAPVQLVGHGKRLGRLLRLLHAEPLLDDCRARSTAGLMANGAAWNASGHGPEPDAGLPEVNSAGCQP